MKKQEPIKIVVETRIPMEFKVKENKSIDYEGNTQSTLLDVEVYSTFNDKQFKWVIEDMKKQLEQAMFSSIIGTYIVDQYTEAGVLKFNTTFEIDMEQMASNFKGITAKYEN